MESLPDEWTDEQNAMFTKVYRFMLANKAAVVHPAMPVVDERHWQTIAHNAAWLAAEFLIIDELRILDIDTQELIAESPATTLNS